MAGRIFHCLGINHRNSLLAWQYNYNPPDPVINIIIVIIIILSRQSIKSSPPTTVVCISASSLVHHHVHIAFVNRIFSFLHVLVFFNMHEGSECEYNCNDRNNYTIVPVEC